MKIADILIDKLNTNKLLQYFFFLGVFAFIFVIMMYFYPLHLGHDLNFHLIRLDALAEAIKDGAFPTYIDYKSVDGYGYGTKWFYSDFVLLPFGYLAQFCGVMMSYKIMILFYTLLCGLISYISLYKVSKNKYIAFIFCLLYTFSYYRLYDVYNRAALGETICLTFMPLVIWGAYEIIKGNYKKWYIISIAFSLMIFSHINTPVIVAFVTSFFFIAGYKNFIKQPIRLAYLALAAIVTILTTAYFLFPFVEQLLSNEFYFALADERAVAFPVMGGEPMKYIIRGMFSGITYVVPEIAGIGIVLTMIVLLRCFVFRDEVVKKGDLFLIVGLICLLIVSPLYPWRIFPFSLIGFIQFSWRFYSVITLILCVAGAVYFFKILQTDKRRYWVGMPLIVILTLLFISNSGQVFTNERPKFEEFSRSSHNYGLMGAEYMPQQVPNINTFFAERGNDSIRTINASTEITNFKRDLRTISFDVSEYTPEKRLEFSELPLVYYKGYKAEIDDKEVEVEQSLNGLVMIPVNQAGHIKVWFGGTLIQNISPYITLVVSILLTVYIIWFNRKNRKANAK